MKAGTRALGIAESYVGRSADDSERPPAVADAESTDSTAVLSQPDTLSRSVLAGAVVRADRVVDGVGFERCTVGGTDATTAVCSLLDSLGRADVRYVLVAGIAPAWFNVLDLRAVAETLDRPVLSVSFESSPGLEPALREQFAGDALRKRLRTYRAQPDRRALSVNDREVFVRAVGCDPETAARVVRTFTPEGGRPEPLRVARLAARAGRRLQEASYRPSDSRN